MKALVVGGGGREHALVWALARDGHTVLCAPGNPGIARHAECVDCGVDDTDGLVKLASERAVDLVVVGPEAPLVAGLSDRLRAAGVPVFGPGADAARLEGSKAFSKQFFARHEINSARFFVCSTVDEANAAVDELGDAVVVKADGLAAGKGVVVCGSKVQAKQAAAEILGGKFGDAGASLVVEQRLAGRELSVMAITDGSRYEVLAQAEDHKAIFDGDRGPNTGGMGTVSPALWATRELIEQVERDILDKTIAGLRADGLDYRGVLYAGLMVGDDGVPFILEYNCRFGDPETQPVMARLTSDLGEWLAGAANGKLPDGEMTWDTRTAVCVILASAGYPASSDKGRPITGVDEAGSRDGVMVFHAGTAMLGGELVTNGGRVLGVTALGDDLTAARQRAYAAADHIRFEGKQFRTDIGMRTT